MIKAVATIVTLSLSSPAFAGGDEIYIPSMAGLPFVVTSTGEEVSGYVNSWGALTQDSGTFKDAVNQAVEQLQQNKCAVHFEALSNAKRRIDPKEGIATIACMQRGGTLVTTEMPGFFLDDRREVGLRNTDVGVKGYFVVQTSSRIPLNSN